MEKLMINLRKAIEVLLKGAVYLSATLTVGVLVWIIGYIFVNGISKIDLAFLTSNYDAQTQYISVERQDGLQKDMEGYIKELGIRVAFNENNLLYIEDIDKGSPVMNAYNRSNQTFGLRKRDQIQVIGDEKTEGKSLEEIVTLFEAASDSTYSLKIRRPGGGVYPMLITTVYIILISLFIAAPIGILAAIYLTEYAKSGPVIRMIRFATESLAGIPSIIYGLFGMLLFVVTLNMGYSIIAGALTLSIILLPVIIRQTEESLKAVPMSYREASFGLGATKLQTISKVIIPSAIPGILVAVILSIGRIVGESAALLLTAGTVASIPNSLFGGGASLTVKAYTVAKEEGNIAMACAIGTVIITLIIVLNLISKLISSRLNRTAMK